MAREARNCQKNEVMSTQIQQKNSKMFENSDDFDFDDETLTSEFTKKSKKPPENSAKKPKKCQKRKFPGPAGILPARKSSNFSFDHPEDTKFSDDPAFLTQPQISWFDEQPWQKMCQDLTQNLTKFTVKWIKTEASLNRLTDNKAPYLAAIIVTLEVSECKVPTVKITLKDKTGEISGTIVHKLYQQYSKSIKIGSVLVLKNLSVLTIGLTNHYIVITTNNLQTIYTKNEKIVIKTAENNIKLCDDLEDELEIPDNFEEIALSQSLSPDNIFEGLDVSDFFDDF